MTDTAKLLKIQQRETDYAFLYKTLKEQYEAPSSKVLFEELSRIRKDRAQKLRELTAYDLMPVEQITKNILAYRKLLKDSGFMKRLAAAEKNLAKEYQSMTEEYPSFAAFSEEAKHCAERLQRESGKMYTEEYLPVGRIKEYVMTFEQPDRPVIVYLHGGPGESVIPFAGFIASGIDFATVIFYDQRGTGRTQLKNNSSPDSITFGALLTDLRSTISQIRKKYGVDKVILLGHSWGTVLGTQYALRYPEDLHCYIGVGQVVDFRDGERMCLDITKERMGTPDEEDQRILDKLGSYPDNLDRKNVLKMILTAR
nr:alpha/beta fold hydrolase [Solobacterium sp.]